MRDFFAENLESLLGMKFLAKEYPTTDGRIDTLALDEANAKGWTVVDMKNDWKFVYPYEMK